MNFLFKHLIRAVINCATFDWHLRPRAVLLARFGIFHADNDGNVS
jgi:hypothetical protein